MLDKFKSILNQKKIQFTAITLLILIALFFLVNHINLKRNTTVDKVQVSTYLSKGSRDTNKTEKSEFSSKNSIQAQITFSKAEDNSRVDFYILDSTGNKVQEVKDISVAGNEGQRYITLNKDIPEGSYVIQIKQGEILLAKSEFTIQ